MSLGDLLISKEREPRFVCVVRLRTSVWSDSKGLHIKRTLAHQKRLSTGFNILLEDLGAIGADEVAIRISNLASCLDGLYRVETCNESRDFETGLVDDYDYRLIPYEPEEKLS